MNKYSTVVFFTFGILMYHLGLIIGYNTDNVFIFPLYTIAFTFGFLVGYVR